MCGTAGGHVRPYEGLVKENIWQSAGLGSVKDKNISRSKFITLCQEAALNDAQYRFLNKLKAKNNSENLKGGTIEKIRFYDDFSCDLTLHFKVDNRLKGMLN